MSGCRPTPRPKPFNAGSPSFTEQVHDKSVQMQAAGEPFYVRGAVTDPSPLGQFSTFITKRNSTAAPDVLVSGVATSAWPRPMRPMCWM